MRHVTSEQRQCAKNSGVETPHVCFVARNGVRLECACVRGVRVKIR